VPAASDTLIRDATAAGAAAVASLYNGYVLASVATFEETPLAGSAMAERLRAVQERGLPWLAAVEDGEVVGYACAGSWNTRGAYRLTAEVTAYVAEGATRHGVGSALYAELFARLRELGIHAVIAVIALPNPASVALHERFGLRHAGTFREVGHKFGRWVDVGYWQGLL
jgi:L-amino acid N-acyltransferase YncA